MTTAVSIPNTDELESKSLSTVRVAQSLTVVDPKTCVDAADFLKGVKLLRREIEETFEESIKAAFAAHRAIVAAKKRHDEPLEQAERIVKAKIAGYQAEEERRRIDAERAAQEAARAAEEEQQIAIAAQLIKEGRREEAEALLAEPVEAPIIHIETAAPKLTGISTAKRWRGEVVDFLALVKYVAAHPEFIGLLEPNESALNALARSLKGNMKVDGVKAVSEDVVSAKVG